ncbi:HD domain-containing protein [Burkholderia sp. IMCC1007]|uniref:HD domain-containing protein n=1 Tax=Burkholderia sp. IMCC1007 TaxID=3004104 RepID=UPI003FA48EB6
MLARCYMEPVRHYHTLVHVRRCLRHLELARDAIHEPDTVELALWFHDVIFVPGAKDNEQRSAEWFRRQADGRIGACEHICAMILATTHVGIADDPDTRFVCDIDLAVLGAARNRFREDGRRLRAERPDLDDRAYDLHERAILRGLLLRPRIYLTDFFYARCERQARRNLNWRLGLPVPE